MAELKDLLPLSESLSLLYIDENQEIILTTAEKPQDKLLDFYASKYILKSSNRKNKH